MSRSGFGRPPPKWRFSIRVAAPVLMAAGLTLSLTAYGVVLAARQSDETSSLRQVKTTELAVEASVSGLAHELETVAVWDDAVIYTDPPTLDAGWVHENLGAWLHQMFGHDQIYVLDAANSAIYAMVGGAQLPADKFEDLRPDVADLIEMVRSLGSILPDRKLRKSTGRAIHVSELRRVAGRPAAVSLMRIVPHSGDEPAGSTGNESLLIGVRFLDGNFLEDLEIERRMDGARFSTDLDLQPEEKALPLLDGTNRRIGYLIWRPETPGALILRQLVPLYLLMAVGVIGILLVLVRVLWKTAKELQTSEAHAHHLALHDPLTGFPNRAQLFERLEQVLAPMRREDNASKFAVLLLDLDRFKQVNDALGHQAGDELLKELAGRLATAVGPDNTIARLGGDEFAVIQRDIAGARDAEALSDRILGCARAPFHVLNGIKVGVGASLGVVIAPDAGLDGIGLLRKADIALYAAKAAGRGRYCVYTDVMDQTVSMRGKLEAELRVALSGDRGLTVYFQPLMASDGSRMTGLEALVRWHHPEMGLLPPMKFLSVAEECGLSVLLDDWVLEQVCRGMGRLPDVPIAVNLSPAQFYTSDLYPRISAIVQRHGVDPRRIELEITENVLLEENELCVEALKKLRIAGFRIALDDFGTGYSSLSYLRRFQVDKIKIDQSFVRHIGRSDESSSLVSAIIQLGRAMGLSVTAEGVETAEQLAFLERAGCHQLQGYLFSPPVPAEQLDSLMLARL